VLTECAFISNPQEEALLTNPAWRERVSRGMVQGIANYVNHYLRQPGTAG
jgi:N-acetylmuramoyl-L-alanine amidase